MYSNTTLVQPYYFRTIDRFYATFIKKGGIIERYEEGIQAIAVSIKISTDGKFNILGTFDKVSSGLVNIGYLFPQKSIPHKTLCEKTEKIVEKLMNLGHIG